MDEKWPIKFSLTITISTEIVRDFLHAAKLRHGTDGFTSPLKEGMLRGFIRPKNPTASAGFEPANSGKCVRDTNTSPLKVVILSVTALNGKSIWATLGPKSGLHLKTTNRMAHNSVSTPFCVLATVCSGLTD
jgi:hypothetical protein